jgi:hypothetical protein
MKEDGKCFCFALFSSLLIMGCLFSVYISSNKAQLTCPISYEDPDNNWSKIEGYINEKLPLKDISWKNPLSSSFITINQLPLRFLPSNASLFKDTEHSFRWFLCSYVNIYVLVAESLDSYKVLKPSVKKWVEQQNTPKG